MRPLARVELGDEVVPDESTILRCRHLLEQHRLSQAIFNSITAKARFCGSAENLARAKTMFALANLYQVRRQLLPIAAQCAR
jgi:IS5 family transposase